MLANKYCCCYCFSQAFRISVDVDNDEEVNDRERYGRYQSGAEKVVLIATRSNVSAFKVSRDNNPPHCLLTVNKFRCRPGGLKTVCNG